MDLENARLPLRNLKFEVRKHKAQASRPSSSWSLRSGAKNSVTRKWAREEPIQLSIATYLLPESEIWEHSTQARTLRLPVAPIG